MIAESWQKAQQGKMGGDMDSMMGGMKDRPKKSDNTKPAKDKNDLNDMMGMMDMMKGLNDNNFGMGKPGDDKNYDPMKAMEMMSKLEKMKSKMEQEK